MGSPLCSVSKSKRMDTRLDDRSSAPGRSVPNLAAQGMPVHQASQSKSAPPSARLVSFVMGHARLSSVTDQLVQTCGDRVVAFACCVLVDQRGSG